MPTLNNKENYRKQFTNTRWVLEMRNNLMRSQNSQRTKPRLIEPDLLYAKLKQAWMRVSTMSCYPAGGVKLHSLAFLLYALTQNVWKTLLIGHSTLSNHTPCRLRIRTPVILYYVIPFFPHRVSSCGFILPEIYTYVSWSSWITKRPKTVQPHVTRLGI